MKCPRCGKEMVMDGHRKIDLFMCYECGYIEGRNLDDGANACQATKIEHHHVFDFVHHSAKAFH